MKAKVRTDLDFESSCERNNKSKTFYNSSTEKIDNVARTMSEREPEQSTQSTGDKTENGNCETILVESSDEISNANECKTCVLTGDGAEENVEKMCD